jgi:hypothetical protein
VAGIFGHMNVKGKAEIKIRRWSKPPLPL